MLAAKAVVVGGATFGAGLVASVVSFLVAQRNLRSETRTPGHPDLSLSDPTVLRAIVGTTALLALVAVLSLGVAAIVRHTAVDIPVVILPLLVPQIIETGLPISVAKWLTGPMEAGLAIQHTTRLDELPIGPWPGLGVLVAWAGIAMLAGTTLPRLRDAQ